MTYLLGFFIFSLCIYAAGKFGNRDITFTPFSNLGIFNLHYMLAGIAFLLVIPSDFVPVFESVRGTVLLFGLCWIGLYYGCGLELRIHQKFSSHIILFNIIETVLVFVLISVLSIIYLYLKVKSWEYTGTALMIGLFASFTIFRRRGILYRQTGTNHYRVLENLLPVGNIFPIIGLAILTRLLFSAPEITLFKVTFFATHAYFLLQLIIAILCGVLLNMLVSGTDSVDAIIIVLLGGTLFISGIVFTLSFSPLLVGTLTGVFLINSTLKRLQTLEALNITHGLVEKIFMFCLGTMITPLFTLLKEKLIYIIVSAIGLYSIRAIIKYIFSSFLISRKFIASKDTSLIWIGLTGQGILASGAALECSYNVPKFTSIFMMFIVLLVLNQLTIGFYVWYSEKKQKVKGKVNA
ncbi:MAG: hypothetical protein JXB48_09145 [Candidatus Latescibacteria bacterium]|nr:hypothetical protein [Candidatus Latescibacterota bacterium]